MDVVAVSEMEAAIEEQRRYEAAKKADQDYLALLFKEDPAAWVTEMNRRAATTRFDLFQTIRRNEEDFARTTMWIDAQKQGGGKSMVALYCALRYYRWKNPTKPEPALYQLVVDHVVFPPAKNLINLYQELDPDEPALIVADEWGIGASKLDFNRRDNKLQKQVDDQVRDQMKSIIYTAPNMSGIDPNLQQKMDFRLHLYEKYPHKTEPYSVGRLYGRRTHITTGQVMTPVLVDALRCPWPLLALYKLYHKKKREFQGEHQETAMQRIEQAEREEMGLGKRGRAITFNLAISIVGAHRSEFENQRGQINPNLVKNKIVTLAARRGYIPEAEAATTYIAVQTAEAVAAEFNRAGRGGGASSSSPHPSGVKHP